MSSFTIKGKLTCPIFRRGVGIADYYTLPGQVKLACKGDGDQASCTASVDVCPDRVYEGDPLPTKPTRKSVKGVRPAPSASRGQDVGGNWNTVIEWDGTWGWDRAERKQEGLHLQLWDDRSDDRSGRPPEVFYGLRVFERPYPRADKQFEHHTGILETSSAERTKVVPVLRRAIAGGGFTRHGGLSVEAFDRAPPIRIGSVEVDWPRRGLAGAHRRTKPAWRSHYRKRA